MLMPANRDDNAPWQLSTWWISAVINWTLVPEEINLKMVAWCWIPDRTPRVVGEKPYEKSHKFQYNQDFTFISKACIFSG